jgi:hypothetical protein
MVPRAGARGGADGLYFQYSYPGALSCTGLDAHRYGSIPDVWVQVRAPTLVVDDVVIENLSVHKAGGIPKSIESAGSFLVYLPLYLPGNLLIESCCSKLKSSLREVTHVPAWLPMKSPIQAKRLRD